MKAKLLLTTLGLITLISLSSAQYSVWAPDPFFSLTQSEKEELKDQAASFFNASKPAVASASKSTVSISHGKGRVSYGTIVTTPRNPKPVILTKWSEVKNAHSLLVVTTSDGKPLLAKVSGVYPEHDLALLSVNAPEPQLTPLDLAKSSSPKLGSFIMLANPHGAVEGFGVVSVKSRSLRDGDKAYLGVMMDFTSEMRNGVPIKQVMQGSAAHKAGLRKDDVIIAVDQTDITGAVEMRNTLQKMMPGSKIIISYMRANARKRTAVRLGSLEDNSTIRRVPRARMEQMQGMGAVPSEVRSNFPSVIQSDMPIQPNDTGAPVTDLDGNIIGITIARGSRIKTFIIPTGTIREVLGSQAIEPDTVLTKQADENHTPHTRSQASRPKAASLEEDPIDQVKRLLGGTGKEHDKNE